MVLGQEPVGSLGPAPPQPLPVPESTTSITIQDRKLSTTTTVTASPVVRAVAGSLGGIVESVCLQPIDVIKTRLQLDHAGKYKGVWGCGKSIYSEEGVRALWKGWTPFATHLTFKYALRFGTNSFFQSLLRDKDGKLTDGARLTAGLGAGVTEALVIVTPFEVIKTRLQQQKGLSLDQMKYKGPLHTAVTVVREEGLRSMWSGATATCLRQGSNQMSMFYGKYVVDKALWDKQEGDGRVLTPGQSMTSGFAAACIGPILNNPFDVVKTRMMVAKDGVYQYSGFVDCLMKVSRNEGVTALWKGLTPRLMRTPPGQAIVWAVTDQVCGYFEKKR